jgi:hypothetical protein
MLKVCVLHSGLGDSICPGQRLPRQFDRAMGALELVVVNQGTFRTKTLGQVAPLRSAFRKHCKIELSSGMHLQSRRISQVNTKEPLDNYLIDWCVIQMMGSPDKQRNWDHALLFAMLQNHLAVSSSSERARFDEILYRRLSKTISE